MSGGGVEFVRAVSRQLYGVAPDRVVGSAVRYHYERRGDVPTLVRTTELDGPPNEGPAKVDAVQRHLGRRPLLAAGNSLGDREMLELAATNHPSLALLIDHDDADREFAYTSEAGTIADVEPITELGPTSGLDGREHAPRLGHRLPARPVGRAMPGPAPRPALVSAGPQWPTSGGAMRTNAQSDTLGKPTRRGPLSCASNQGRARAW